MQHPPHIVAFFAELEKIAGIPSVQAKTPLPLEDERPKAAWDVPKRGSDQAVPNLVRDLSRTKPKGDLPSFDKAAPGKLKELKFRGALARKGGALARSAKPGFMGRLKLRAGEALVDASEKGR